MKYRTEQHTVERMLQNDGSIPLESTRDTWMRRVNETITQERIAQLKNIKTVTELLAALVPATGANVAGATGSANDQNAAMEVQSDDDDDDMQLGQRREKRKSMDGPGMGGEPLSCDSPFLEEACRAQGHISHFQYVCTVLRYTRCSAILWPNGLTVPTPTRRYFKPD